MAAARDNKDACSVDGMLKLCQSLLQGSQLICAGFDVCVDESLMDEIPLMLGPLHTAQNEAACALRSTQRALLEVVQSQRVASGAMLQSWADRIDHASRDISGWQKAYTQLGEVAANMKKQNNELVQIIRKFELDTAEQSQRMEWMEQGHGLVTLKARNEISALRHQIEDIRGTWGSDNPKGLTYTRQALTPYAFQQMRLKIQEQQKRIMISDTELKEARCEKEQAMSLLEQTTIIEDLLSQSVK